MTSPVEINSPESIRGPENIGDHSLQKMAHMLLIEKLEKVDGDVRDEVRVLVDRQKRIEFLDRFTREVNANIESSSETLDRGQLKEVIHEGLKLKDEADQLRIQADNIASEAAGLRSEDEFGNAQLISRKEGEAKWLRDSADEIYTTLRACDIVTKEGEIVDGPSTYLREATTRLLENIRSYAKILQTRNNTQSQKVQRLNNERHEVMMLAKDIARTISDILKRIASHIGGR